MESPKKRKKLGPVTAETRRAYLARLGPDAKWGRPTAKTAGVIWTLLKNRLPYRLDDFLPRSKSPTRPAGAEYERAALVAKQSLVIALDCAIGATDRSKMLTQNLLLEALAKHWSIRFRQVQRNGVHTLYDVEEETARRVWRELLLAGVRVDTLWQIVAGEWSRTEDARNPLFWVSRIRGKRHALGWRVNVRADSPALRAFQGAAENDTQYRRRGQRRIFFEEDWKQRPRRVRQEICAERPYNVVNLGDGSERVLTILEQARAKFNVEIFRNDYKTIAEYAKAHPPSNRSQWREYRRLRAFVSSYRRVYQEMENIPLETSDEWEQWGDQPGDGGLRPKYLSGHRWIRSRFFRAQNRRFHALNFWPEHVPKVFRDRWFGVWVEVPRTEEVVQYALDELPELEIDEGGPAHGRFVDRDVSSSQTQILAVLLGLPELEDLATSTNPKFKHWLAQELWRLHENTPGGLLADGYLGAGDERLVEFIKAHWMRRMYGSELQQIIWKLGKERPKYGPGWRTGIDDALRFLTSLPPWADEVENFLEMCKHLSHTYHLKDGDINRGVVFHDPLDGSEVRWHHAQRGRLRLGFGHFKIEIHPPGVNQPRETFWPLPPGTIDRKKLGQFIPPCLIHMLDAFFSGLVIQGLRDAGITDIVALHDDWRVPEMFQAEEDGPVLDGRAVLEDVISEAGAEWLEGLRDVYDRLVYYLGDDPTFGGFVREIRGRWEKRVQDQRWPRFTVG